MKTVGYIAILALVASIVYLGVNKDTPEYKSTSEIMHIGR